MRRPSTPHLTASAVLVLSLTLAATASGNWPKFRGPNAGVVSDDPKLPDTWSPTANVAWRLPIPGFAWSSPIVWGDLVFVTTVISDEPRPTPDLDPNSVANPHTGGQTGQKPQAKQYRWVLYAVDVASGKVRWERELHQGLPESTKHSKNSWASETPVTDGKHVYVYHADAGLFAVDYSGKLVWSRPFRMPTPTGTERVAGSPVLEAGGTPRTITAGTLLGMGQAASPALYRDRLFISADSEPGQWLLAAFDARTGKELWRVVEPKKKEAYGWSSPFVWAHEQRTEIITAGNNRVRSYNPDGQLLWELEGMSLNTTPTPFAAHGLLFVSSGYPADPLRPIYAIRPGAKGNISLGPDDTSSAHVAWSQRTAASYMPSALVYGDYYYTLYSQGFLTCHDARTGRQIYGRQRIAIGAGAFTASPWAYNGRIFAASEDGDVYVIQAGPGYKLLGKNSLGEMILATPAIAEQSLFVRTAASLWRIGSKE
jgi:outer membrane protein assembly factor BamB